MTRHRSALAKLGRRIKREPRVRHFGSLGWSVFLLPIDLFEYRGVAKMYIGTWYDFKPDELVTLRARRLQFDGEPERTWWVIAAPKAAVVRRAIPGTTPWG